MGNLLDDVQTLIAKRVGDIPRLENIKENIENNKQLYDSDRKYIDELIKKYIFSDETSSDEIVSEESTESKDTISETKHNESFCPKCGKSVGNENEFCPKCGSGLKGQPQSTQNKQFQRPVEWKSESTTLLLSILLGLFGIQGVGHMYVGKIGKGVVILIGSIILLAIAIGLTATGIGAILGVPLIIGYFVMFIWQILDSKKLCGIYNRYLEEHQRPINW